MLPFRSNDNGIEWKFVVIDKIMYYTEETIRNFFRKMVSIIKMKCEIKMGEIEWHSTKALKKKEKVF